MQTPSNRPATIIELVGSGGAGKTTLASRISSHAAVHVLRVGHTKGPAPVAAGMIAAARLALKYRLSPIQWLSLARKCSAVEHALRQTEGLKGVWIVDEGPLRCLRERRCQAGAELQAWTDYARETIEKLHLRGSKFGMVVVHLERAVQLQRHRDRTCVENARRTQLGWRSRLGFRLDRRLQSHGSGVFLKEAVDEMMNPMTGSWIATFVNSPEETPDQMAGRFAREFAAQLNGASSSAAGRSLAMPALKRS